MHVTLLALRSASAVVPTAAMALGSFILTKVEVSPKIGAVLQVRWLLLTFRNQREFSLASAAPHLLSSWRRDCC
jgi:hypothetical protein